MTPEARGLYGLIPLDTSCAGLTEQEAIFRKIANTAREEGRDEARKFADDVLRQKIQAELESFTDDVGEAPRYSLTNDPRAMRFWSVGIYDVEDLKIETGGPAVELAWISEQILRLLLLYRAKRDFFVHRGLRAELLTWFPDEAVLRMVRIATTDEQCLEITADLSSNGFIPVEHCPEAVEYGVRADDSREVGS